VAYPRTQEEKENYTKLINRLRIEHTFITHNHLMTKRPTQMRKVQKYEDTRKKLHFSQQIGKPLGPNLQSVTNIIQFIKEKNYIA